MKHDSALVTAAKQGREGLATALLSLQTSGVHDVALEHVIEDTALASSALYDAESTAQTEEATTTYIHSALEALQRSRTLLDNLRALYPQLEVGAAAVARTLALLYPVLQHSARQRRARIPAGGLSDSDARELRTMAAFPRAPAPTGRYRRPSGFDGAERRAQTTRRVFVEVEIGMTSESHIYTGLSLDVSTGGVFVATYDAAPAGTAVSLSFVLPAGQVVNAEGVVRWTRGASADSPPGMGVAFTSISRESLEHIAAFCASRPPLYFDD